MATTLYWITNDLRLSDNPALLRASQSDALICVYCVDQRWFLPHRYHISSMGLHRWRYLNESLAELGRSLRDRGQYLDIKYGYTEQQLSQLIDRHPVNRLVCSRQNGSDERRILSYLQSRFPNLQVVQVDNNTLYELEQIDTELSTLKQGFAAFRQRVQNLPPQLPIQTPDSLPRPPLRVVESSPLPAWLPTLPPLAANGGQRPGADNSADLAFPPGESAASSHARRYFESELPMTYKETRNALSGRDNSSRLSAALSQGCLSVRRAAHMLQRHEEQNGVTASSQHLLQELLWREYFHWLALAQHDSLYRLKGLRKQAPHACLHPERYQKWCHGNTPWPLVNACMKELKATGYLSNRGRQIAASCFVNELGMDWRYGAAWFEHQLVDYDVASNWGNWQYIAGVGVDPRGGRHFNIEKQAAQFDPHGDYVRHWAPEQPNTQLDSVDAADWPVS